MDLHVLTGDDESGIASERLRLFASTDGTVEEIDVSVDSGAALIAALRTPSMFTQRKLHACSIGSLSTDNLGALVEIGPSCGALVVATADKALSPKIRAGLSKVGVITRMDVPRGAKLAGAVDELARNSAISLPAQGRQLCGEFPIARVRSAFALLIQAGISNPTLVDLAGALGSDRTETPPWALTDAITKGDHAQAFELSGKVIGPVAVSVLINHFSQVALLIEVDARDVESAMEILGLGQRFRAEKLLGEARRRDLDTLYRVLGRLGDASVAVRSSRGAAELSVAVSDVMSYLLHSGGAGSPHPMVRRPVSSR